MADTGILVILSKMLHDNLGHAMTPSDITLTYCCVTELNLITQFYLFQIPKGLAMGVTLQ